ncbi:hypothetical protein [Fulvivirga sediminis]|uniref:Uncharacterized protein n=1 Tax=Fulvivirga sediminis TaxID=2803949 RepID=A0A937K3C1_9BACT|nr:hypothetical protein [Fulvivirga sediminis]MBL3658812.1 hypothetical protein [Fulvivirga sediminis]
MGSEKAMRGVFRLYTGSYASDFYSYIVWYMYKGRSLPLGEVFDEYREKDRKERIERKIRPSYKSAFNKRNVQPEATELASFYYGHYKGFTRCQ